MSNKLYEIKFYNEYQKERYLKTVKPSEYDLNRRILGRASRTEELYGKDLFDFSFPEIAQFLRYLKPSKFTTARNYFYVISNYVDWADSQYLRQGNINQLTGMGDTDFLNSVVDDSMSSLFSEDEINEVIKGCVNAQDAVIVKLIFEGVLGREADELLNLHKNSVDFENNRLLLKDLDGSTRFHVVSDECMGLISAALSESEYVKRNGEIAEGNISSTTTNLVSNEFVLKTGATRNKGEEKAHSHLVYRRLKMLGEIFDMPKLTTNSIRDSGMLKMAKDLYEKNGKLEKDEYETILKHFNVGKPKGKDVYSISFYKTAFLNLETIQKVYGK